MRVRVVRRGGIAGVALETTLDTGEIDGVDAAATEADLRGLPWGRAASPPTRADQFSYEISTDDGGGRCTVLREDEVPPALRPVLARAARNGVIRPASR